MSLRFALLFDQYTTQDDFLLLNLFIPLQNCSFIIIYSSLEMISELDVSELSQYVSELDISKMTRERNDWLPIRQPHTLRFDLTSVSWLCDSKYTKN